MDSVCFVSLTAAHFSLIFIFQEEGRRERGTDKGRECLDKGTRDREQPITTSKICWKQSQEMGPLFGGKGGSEIGRGGEILKRIDFLLCVSVSLLTPCM